MTTPKIAIIIGSTRDARFGEKPAKWLLERAQQRDDFDVELVDLKDFDLPLFNEKASNLWMPSEDPAAIAWQEKIAEFDGYIFVTAEYNHSLTGSLKNALDQAYKEWVRKPMGALGYGGLGAARAVEHLRGIGVELQMVPVRNAVHIAAGSFMKVSPMGENAEMEAIEDVIGGSADALFDDMAWWANATKVAREA
ncbi:NAD(P)H-dependent oxidoreductase [Oceanicola sp. D3]|uniref:NADPH-dependent FMN reductase n=1 Tax=Oceanicola sp. D3 TaxID=2587163 RepID=UPI001121A373|nr:NAD(P)H-dependent oxidoreductase [Oceanicola sp. D3]QDC09259.1 NAD(P)H-dependent oxidoreductase [Oceanicola sp. D3]